MKDPVKEAMFYERREDEKVQCHLCAHHCVIAPEETGVCQVRINQEGTLYTRVYGRTIAANVDPVEKKPLLHFRPGTLAYSVAAPGCNFRCQWCQNWEISQMPTEQHFLVGRKAAPEDIVAAARSNNCRSIAYTYTEPTIFFEYAHDTAQLAREAGLANIYVTNGYMTEAMMETAHPYIDAANVDLKAFRDATYRRYVGARLEPVLDSLRLMKEHGIWLEVTTLIIPELNDDEAELRDAANFIAEELGAETPWHLSRFHPTYQMLHVPPTPETTLRQAQIIGKDAGLRYVYVGNIPGESNTNCHACGELLIQRVGYQIVRNYVESGELCPNCGTEVAGVGMAG
jgi:pyruvate formate lyase activating enzyme